MGRLAVRLSGRRSRSTHAGGYPDADPKTICPSHIGLSDSKVSTR